MHGCKHPRVPVQPARGICMRNTTCHLFLNYLQAQLFKEYCWPLPLYLDKDKAVFKQLHGGKVARGPMAPLLNPFSKTWTNVMSAQSKGNLVGDGRTLGGHMVVTSSGQVVFNRPEVPYGIFAPVMEVRSASFGLQVCNATHKHALLHANHCSGLAAYVSTFHQPHSFGHCKHKYQQHMLYTRIIAGNASVDEMLLDDMTQRPGSSSKGLATTPASLSCSCNTQI